MAFGVPHDDGGEADFGTFGGGSGGGGGIIGRRVVPPAPTEVKVKVTDIGAFTVTWRDYNQSSWPHDIAFDWFVRFCPVGLAGPQGGETDWVLDVLHKSKHVGSLPAVGHGELMTVAHNEILPDGYVMVVGSTGPSVGPPSFPFFVNLTGNTNQVPDNVLSDDLTVAKERIPYDVLRFDGHYRPAAATIKDFAGMELYMVGYDGLTVPQELGAMVQWDKSTGLIPFTYRLPIETGQGSGTSATFTNGSSTVTRNSGTGFGAGWVGRRIIVDVSSAASQVYTINTVTPANTLTLTSPFTGTTGAYSWKVLNNTTFYFVSIGKSGVRLADYTTAPSVAI